VLTGLRGVDLLRVKGLVAVEAAAARSSSMPCSMSRTRPVELEDWPDGDRRSRLVFITRNLGRSRSGGYLRR